MTARPILIGLTAAGFAVAPLAASQAPSEVPVTIAKSFPAGKVTVDGFRGTVTITTSAPGSAVSVRATGKAEPMKRLDVRQEAGGILIRLESRADGVWWPWSMLDWSQQRDDDVVMIIGAPKGTEFDMDEIVGKVSAGDLDAPLRFGGTGGGSAKFGRVTRARVSVAGSMNISVGDSQGPVDAAIAGSGSITIGASTQARLDVAGNGEFKSGPVAGGFDASIAGSGDAEVASVNGPVSLEIAGSGNVVIKGGRADPFKVSIAGSGDVTFDGEAVNPEISIAGSGNVAVGSMSGNLSQDMQGSGEFTVRKGTAPAAPSVPPAPPLTPAAPAAKPAAPVPPTPPAPPPAP
jgi:hypothetical protein